MYIVDCVKHWRLGRRQRCHTAIVAHSHTKLEWENKKNYNKNNHHSRLLGTAKSKPVHSNRCNQRKMVSLRVCVIVSPFSRLAVVLHNIKQTTSITSPHSHTNAFIAYGIRTECIEHLAVFFFLRLHEFRFTIKILLFGRVDSRRVVFRFFFICIQLYVYLNMIIIALNSVDRT